jgi:hypothetical protein
MHVLELICFLFLFLFTSFFVGEGGLWMMEMMGTMLLDDTTYLLSSLRDRGGL